MSFHKSDMLLVPGDSQLRLTLLPKYHTNTAPLNTRMLQLCWRVIGLKGLHRRLRCY